MPSVRSQSISVCLEEVPEILEFEESLKRSVYLSTLPTGRYILMCSNDMYVALDFAQFAIGRMRFSPFPAGSRLVMSESVVHVCFRTY